MLPQDKEELLNQIRLYLEDGGGETMDKDPQADLYAIFGELATLKNEVRIESRQVKGALDQFRALVEPLQNSQAVMQGEIARLREENQQTARQALRPLLLELLDIRDRLVAALEMSHAKHWSKKLFKRLCRKEHEMLESWQTGQKMLLTRLDQTLAAREVVPLRLVNTPLDPRLARAVRVEQQKGVADGVVLVESRQGFLWKGELLRLAEVVVNKLVER